MKKIQDLVDQIDDELCDAKSYAEKYIDCKAFGNSANANKYKEMSLDELKHATYLHEMAIETIKTIGSVFTAPVEMQEVWETSHKEYIEKHAWIKQMLTM